MTELHWPWLETAVLVPLLGALWAHWARDAEVARMRCLITTAVTCLLCVAEWRDFEWLKTFEAHDRWDFLASFLGGTPLLVDELSAPLLPLAAVLYFLTALATLRTKIRRFSFSWSLVGESLLLATLSCRNPWGVIGLLALSTIPPWIELRRRGQSTRVYSLHLGTSVLLMVVGWWLVERTPPGQVSLLGIGVLMMAVFLRCGIVPVHCWITDLFEKATFGTALLFVTPMVGAYAAVRLVLPIAPAAALRGIALVSLFTAVYAAGMALVQSEPRRLFCYLFLSHSSLVLVGLETATPIGLAGALCVWLSVGIALAGFGLTLRSVEARVGRLALNEYHGLYEQAPLLAVLFLMTGLASVGFPGTIGFVATELLVDGAVQTYPFVGAAVVLAATLNGIAVLQAYFHLFTGTRRSSSIPLGIRLPEMIAVLVLAALIFGGGLLPQPGVASRFHAAQELIRTRRVSAAALPESSPSRSTESAAPERIGQP